MTEPAVAAEDAPRDETRPDPVAAEQELATGQTNGRRRLLNRTKEAMEPVSYSKIAELQDSVLEVTAHHPELTREGGRSSIVAEVLLRVDRLWEELTNGVGSWTASLAFERSVTVRLKAVPDNRDQVGAARHLATEAPEVEPSLSQVVSLIPDGVAAADVTARLLALPADEGPEQASRFGGGVLLAYRALARALDADGITVEVNAGPVNREARITPETAHDILQRLDEPATVPPIDLTVRGTLVRQDSEEARFRVRLDKERAQPTQVKRRKYVEGGYTTQAKSQAEAQNLWDRRVRASVRAHREVVPGRDEPRIVRFDFTDLTLDD